MVLSLTDARLFAAFCGLVCHVHLSHRLLGFRTHLAVTVLTRLLQQVLR